MKLKLFIIIPFFVLLTGCFDYNELNKLSLVTGLSIDIKNGIYEVGILTPSAKKDSDSNVVLIGRGRTLSEALNDIENLSPKKLYLGHLGFVIISDSIAKNGLSEVTDFLIREPASAKRFYMLLAKDSKAIDVLRVISPNLNRESQSLYQNIKISNDSQDFSLNVPFIEFVETLVTDGLDGVMPSIKINITKGKREAKIDAIGLFRDDNLVGYASLDASIGINLLRNSINRTVISSKCNGGNIAIDISNINTKVNVSKTLVNIKIYGNAYLKESNCYTNNNNGSKRITNKDLEDIFEKEIINRVEKAISESKNYESDIFGYGNLIYRRNPNYFNSIKSKWNNKYYKKLSTNIIVSIKLSNDSSIKETIKEVTFEK